MKKILILSIISLLLVSCSKPEEPIKQEPKNVIVSNINGKVIEINEENLTLQSNGNNYVFNIKDVEIEDIIVDDDISVIYNGNLEDISSVKINSIVLQKRENKEPTIQEVIGKVTTGTNYQKIVITDDKQTLSLLNETVEIMFEGDLIPGMNIKVTYLPTKNEEYDGILQSLEILEN